MKREKAIEVVYRPESAIKNPGLLIASMFRDLSSSRYVAWRIFLRDINARYRQTLLGFFWAFIPPIAVAIGFTWAGQSKVIAVGETSLPYPAYVMLSMVLWQTFTESVMGPVQGVHDAKMMLAKINFPREAIVLAKIWEVLFGFGIKLILVVALFVWFKLPVAVSTLLAFPALLMLICLGIAIGTLLAPAAALYQDVTKALTIGLGVWLFMTPVVYPLPLGEGIGAQIVRSNPVTAVLVTIRDLATGSPPTMLTAFVIVSLLSILVLGFSWIVYRLAMPYVIERLSA